MKRSVVLILVLALLGAGVALAAGRQEPAPAPAAPDAARARTPIEMYQPGYAYPTQRVTLDYWHTLEGRPGYHELALELAKEYSVLHPNVTIEVRRIPNAQQRAIWSAAFESSTAPDVAWLEAGVGLAARGLLEMPAWAARMIDELYIPYAQSMSKVGGKYFGWTAAELDVGQMLYYSKDLFREAGLNPNRAPETTTDFLEAAKKVTQYDAAGNIKVAGVGLRYSGGHQGIGDKFSKYAMPFMDTTQKFFYDKDWRDVVFDHPEWIEAAGTVKDLIFKHKVSNTTLPIPDQAVAQGLAAMTFRETFYWGFLKANAPGREYGIGPFPNGRYKTGAVPWIGLMSVTRDTKNADLAWDFCMFLTTPENELRMTKNNGGMSRIKAHQNDPYFRELPYYDVVQTMWNDRPIVQNPYLDPNALVAELEAKLGEYAIQLMTDAGADPAQLMREMAQYGRQRLAETRR